MGSLISQWEINDDNRMKNQRIEQKQKKKVIKFIYILHIFDLFYFFRKDNNRNNLTSKSTYRPSSTILFMYIYLPTIFYYLVYVYLLTNHPLLSCLCIFTYRPSSTILFMYIYLPTIFYYLVYVYLLTDHPLLSCLCIFAPESNNFDTTSSLPSLAAYINGDKWYLKQKTKPESEWPLYMIFLALICT